MYEAQPNFDRSELDEGHEAVCGLVVAGCDTPGVLELVEEAFDAIAQSVESRIDRTLNFAVRLRRDDGIGSVEPGIFTDGLAVIAFVAQ